MKIINYGKGQKGIKCDTCGQHVEPHIEPELTIQFTGEEYREFTRLINNYPGFEESATPTYKFATQVYRLLRTHGVYVYD